MRIETRYLDDATLTDADFDNYVERFADAPSNGGTAIAAGGTIYLSDTGNDRILTVSSKGR